LAENDLVFLKNDEKFYLQNRSN